MSDEGSISTVAPAARSELSAASTGSGSRGLGRVIDDLVGGVPLGDTEVGKSWCLKALHPADTSVLSAPMPANETRSFASVAFQQMNTLTKPAAFAAQPWDLEIRVLRDPVLLYAWRATQSGAADAVGFVFSSQYYNVGAPSYNANYNALRGAAEKFRVTSHSVTAYFDASSQTDQGHVVAGQTDLPLMKLAATTIPPPVADIAGQVPWVYYQDAVPTYDTILQTTRCYQGPATEGVYAPSKLQNLGAWVRTNQSNMMLGTPSSLTPFGFLGAAGVPAAETTIADFQNTFPYTTVPAGGLYSVFDQTDSTITSVFFKNIAPASAVRTTMRWSLDLIVRPGTSYAPFVRMPPVEDRLALKMYSEVSRRMADAYPGSYNNLGALLGIVGKIATAVLPSLVPTVTDWVTGLGKSRALAYQRGERAKPMGFGESFARRLMYGKEGPAGATAAAGPARFQSNVQRVLTEVIPAESYRTVPYGAAAPRRKRATRKQITVVAAGRPPAKRIARGRSRSQSRAPMVYSEDALLL